VTARRTRTRDPDASYPPRRAPSCRKERWLKLIGVRIREAREAKGWSVFDLARAADVKSSWIANVERGHVPSTTTLYDLANALGVDARELLP
jgi:ribosome-binding protein aMBF1 (putative translation factor)